MNSNYSYFVEGANGTTAYYNSRGQLHRLDGPAIIYHYGMKAWYVNGNLHREDGPAIELPQNMSFVQGQSAYWYEGKMYTEETHPRLKNLLAFT